MSLYLRLILSSFAIAIFPGLLCAQDFYWNTASARSISMGGSYVPSASGVLDALTVNPAGLTELDGRALDLSVAGVFARGSFSNSVNRNAPLNDSPGAIPYGAFGMRIGQSRFSFGVGELPELTSVANWNYADSPGVAGASYGLQHEKSAILAGRSTAGLGVRVSSILSLGMSVGVDYNVNTLEAPYTFQSQPVVKGLKTLLDLHTSGFGWNTSVGALLRPVPRVQIQTAWKSRTVIDSTGSASGTLAQQFTALGLAAQPAWTYSAAVRNVLPQSVVFGLQWSVDPQWMIAFQADWVNWKRAFNTLPVALTDGSNPDIDGLLNSTSLNDAIPLDWKNQVSVHAGFERLLGENLSIRGGYEHSNNPVPGSTLTPLTAAIFPNQFTAGAGCRLGPARLDLAYTFDPLATGRVGQSLLLSGEYNQSVVQIGTQMIVLTTEFRF